MITFKKIINIFKVGFNAGDNVNFFALPGSRQPSVLEVAETTNVDLKGRWMFRIDSATIVAGSSCEPVTGRLLLR